MVKSVNSIRFAVIGGGFYGCCLALFLRSISEEVFLLEAKDSIMARASSINQARVHGGYHYPRSIITALKSLILSKKFAQNFPNAIIDDFDMLYGIAKKKSKTPANRFFKIFSEMGAPINRAGDIERKFFNCNTIEEVFKCKEFAFDCSILRKILEQKLLTAKVDVRLKNKVIGLFNTDTGVELEIKNEENLHVDYVFNITYGQINNILGKIKLPSLPLKHELVEIALLKVPTKISSYGFTVMDGPFPSFMPFPSEGTYSLTHVNYSPRATWVDGQNQIPDYWNLGKKVFKSNHKYMIMDGSKYIPLLIETTWIKSLYEIKTLIIDNEINDGRPILYYRDNRERRIFSILGAKIDNVYDLFDMLKREGSFWNNANERYLI